MTVTVDEVQRVVDGLAEDLGRSVVVNDPGMHLLHASRHFADEDPVRIRAVLQRDPGAAVAEYVLGLGVTDWTAPGVVPAHPAIELRSRLCVPVRRGPRLLGLLLVIDPEATLRPEEVARIVEAADAIAVGLAERELEATRTSATAERHVAALLDGGPDERAGALRALVADGTPDRPHAVVTVLEVQARLRPAEVTRALRTALAAHARRGGAPGAATVEGDRGRLVTTTACAVDRAAQAAAARRLAGAVEHALGRGVTVRVGVGGDVPGLASAWRSGAEAAIAVRGARLLPRLGGTARIEDVAGHALLLRLPDDALDADLVPGLRTLLDHESGPRLRATLEAFLDLAGSVPRTAERLHLHRTSLHYRLARITEITGADLDDGEQRLVLHQGLRALELLEGRG